MTTLRPEAGLHPEELRLPPETAALDRAAEHHLTPCGQGAMVWRRWGRGEPVVLVHGGSGSWTHWVRTLPALVDRYEVWACDLPGLGGSAMPSEPWTPASSSIALAEGLAFLIPAERRPRVAAFSFGAHVATLALGRLGRHVRSYTITGCSALGLRGPRDMPGLPKERSTMDAAERQGVHRKVLEMLMFADPERIDEVAVGIQRANVMQARFRSREFALTDEVRRGLADVVVPLRAIWGAEDAVARPSIEAVFEVLREHHPEILTHIIPGAGHWVMYEAADAYNAKLVEMLESA